MGRTAKGWVLIPRRGVQHVRFTHAGQRYEISTRERDLGKASKRAAAVYAEVISGRRATLKGVITSTFRLDELQCDWLEAYEAERPDTAPIYTLYARGWCAFFDNAPERITAASMADFMRSRLREVGADSVRKELSSISVFLDWCLERGFLDAKPLVPRVGEGVLGTRATTRKEEPTELNVEQVRALLAAMPERRKRDGAPMRAFYTFCYETGLRPSTARKIRWGVHYTAGAPSLRITKDIDKARFARHVPLTAAAREAVAVGGEKGDFVFGRRDYRAAWGVAVKASGLPAEATPYDLRHARINHLLDAGFTLPDVGFLVGHKRLTTTNEYASNERKALETKLFGAILGPLHNATIPKEVANMNDSAGAKEGGRTPTPFRALEPEARAPDIGIEKPARFPWQRGQEGAAFGDGSVDTGAGPQIDSSRLAFGVDSLLDPDAYLAALAAERADDDLLAEGVDIALRAIAAGEE